MGVGVAGDKHLVPGLIRGADQCGLKSAAPDDLAPQPGKDWARFGAVVLVGFSPAETCIGQRVTFGVVGLGLETHQIEHLDGSSALQRFEGCKLRRGRIDISAHPLSSGHLLGELMQALDQRQRLGPKHL